MQILGRNAIEVSLAKTLSDKRKPNDPPFNQRSNFGDSYNSGTPTGNFGGFHSTPPLRDGSFSTYDFVGRYMKEVPFPCLDTNNFGAFGGDNAMGGGPPPAPRSEPPHRGGNRGGVSNAIDGIKMVGEGDVFSF